MASPKVKHVVVDAVAFFKNVQLQEIADNVYTSYGVVNEIRDSATRQRLSVLPYELKCREPSSEAIQTVSDFARKTGDYASLSAVDLRVLALAYQITKEQLGEEHLYHHPEKKVTLSSSQRPLEKATDVVGFVYPKTQIKDTNQEESNKDTSEDQQLVDKLNELNTSEATSTNAAKGDIELTLTELEAGNRTGDHTTNTSLEAQCATVQKSSTEDRGHADDSVSRTSENQEDTLESTRHDLEIAKDVGGDDRDDEEIKDCEKENQLGVEEKEEEEAGEEEEEEEEEDEDGGEDDDDDEGWITPSNLAEAHKGMGGLDEEVADIDVGCMTTDFAMQNVLIQMGIPVLSMDGLRIRRAKSFVLRCYGCFKTTTNTNKKFCPGCGNQTLSKVSVSVDDTGSQHLHFSKRKMLNKRGLKYSLPLPKGGKHSDNPVLVADQPQPRNHLPRKARTQTDVFDPDYVANMSPFAMKDLTSRSAQLGVGNLSGNTSRNRRNPNEARRKRGKKK